MGEPSDVRPRFVLRKSGRFWRVFQDDKVVYENSDYAKAVGVFDFLAFWQSPDATIGRR